MPTRALTSAGLLPKPALEHALALALVFVIAASASCGSSGGGGGATDVPPGAPACTEGAPGCLGWVDCPPGFEKDTSLAAIPGANACRDIQPDADCAPGTMPTLGSRDCAPVGWTTCPAGFTQAASGWGCDEVLPTSVCTGATRESLGSTSCTPVGDCNAPFPPPSATLFVNAAYLDGQLDTTHFRVIGDALTKASAGATIAVEAGTYNEGLGPARAVTIVGRCADKVHLVGSALRYPGVFSRGVKGIVASGMTFEGHFQGVRAEGGGTITVSDIVIESPRLSGLIAYQPGSTVTASRVVVRNTVPEPTSAGSSGAGATADTGGKLDITDVVLAGSSDVGLSATNPSADSKTSSSVTAHRTVIRDSRPTKTGSSGSGIASFDGCSIAFDGGVVTRTYGAGLLVQGGGASANVTNTVIRGTTLSVTDGISGGIVAYEQSKVTLDSVSVVGNEQSGIWARGTTNVKVSGSVVQGTKPQADGAFGMGVWADQGANVEVSKSAIVDNQYYGLAALDPGTMLHASGSIVRGTKRDPNDHLGRALNVEDAALVRLEDVSLVANGDESLFVRGGVKGKGRSHVVASRLIVRDTVSRKDGSTGDGVSVEGGALLELDMAAIVRARRAGILLNDLRSPDGLPSEATIAHTVVRDTQAAGDGLGADAKGAIPIEGVGIASGGKLTLASSAVTGNVQFGIVLGEATSAGSSVTSTLIAGTLPKATGEFGHGIVGVDGTTVLIKNAIILSNVIGAAFESATATLADVLVQKNAVGIHIQGDSQLQTAPVAPDAPAHDVVTVTDDSQFIENATRVGSGTVPLPSGPISSGGSAQTTPAKTK
jgi:hypothetical protein